ncbi:MAG: HAD family phosphatase [Rhizobium sp.]|nr:HAD family phosphatase [Rhizobium sp.]
MRRPALVLFDLDGVLAHYDHAPRLRVLAERTGATPAAVNEALFESGLERSADLGQIDTAGVLDELSRRLGVTVSLDDCLAARAAAMQANAAVLELAGAAARHARLAILTNNSLMLRDHLAALCPPLAPLFGERVFCSAQFGLAKPEPELFRRCLDELGVAPAQALFFDDKPDNAKGARRAGLRAHTYRDVPGLRAHLAAHDLLEPRHDPH